MQKPILIALLVSALLPSAHAQQQPSKIATMPSVYPSMAATKSAFVYIPGQIAVASEGTKPGFDRKTAESLKRYCPGIKVLALPKEANYVIFYSEEWKRDLTVIRNDGEVVFAGNSFWTKKSVVGRACAEILKDWRKHTSANSKVSDR